MLAILINFWAYWIEFRGLRRNEGILTAVYDEVDRVRAERGQSGTAFQPRHGSVGASGGMVGAATRTVAVLAPHHLASLALGAAGKPYGGGIAMKADIRTYRSAFFVALIINVLLAAGFGYYWWYSRSATKMATNKATEAQTTATGENRERSASWSSSSR